MRVLLVEDEPKVSEAVAHVMRQNQFQVDVAADGEEGLILAEKGIYDVIVLDIMLPGMSGLEILTSLRLKGEICPIMLLTARDSVPDRVQGLERGADDYLVKPFAMAEFIARVKALSRRIQSAYISNNILSIGNIELNTDKLLLQVNKSPVTLTFKETQIMEIFMRNPDQVFTKEHIIERVWGYDNYVVENNVEIYIHHLRKKLGEGSGVRIKTIRGVGYSLEAE